MASPGILLLGENDADLRAFASRLTGQDQIAGRAVEWTLSNKYFTVNLTVTLRTPEEGLQDPSIDHQAVVVVVTAAGTGADPPLARAQRLWAHIEDQGAEYDIKLAVGLGSASNDEWAAAADAWFAERLVEFVVVGEGDPGSSSEAPAPLAEGGAEGMQRVVEALSSHMWPGMRQQQPTAASGSAGGGGEATTAQEAVEVALGADLLGRDDEDEDDGGLDQVFNEIMQFRSRAGGMSREQVADAAGDLVLRLRSLLGDDDSGSEDDEGAALAAGQEGGAADGGTANGNSEVH